MYNNYTQDNDSYQSCHVIVSATPSEGSLLIGDFNSATDYQIIKKHNITTIITAATGMQHLQISPNITHITYPLLDSKSENIRKFFDESSETIKQSLKRGSVLVHCAAGISRSSTLVLAYLMKSRKIGFKQAIAFVRSKRKNVCPNLGFQRQLKKYEKQLLEKKEDSQQVLKKTASEKLSEQIRTSYNSSHHSGNIKDYFKFQPRTAEESVRRRHDFSRRQPPAYSNGKQRERRNFQVRALTKQRDSLMIYGHNNKLMIPNLQKINPPIIQNYPENAINSHWGKMRKFRLGN